MPTPTESNPNPGQGDGRLTQPVRRKSPEIIYEVEERIKVRWPLPDKAPPGFTRQESWISREEWSEVEANKEQRATNEEQNHAYQS